MNNAYLFGRKIPFPLSIYLGVDLMAWVVILIYYLFINVFFWGFFSVFHNAVLVSLLVYRLHFSTSLPAFAILVPTLTLVFPLPPPFGWKPFELGWDDISLPFLFFQWLVKWSVFHLFVDYVCILKIVCVLGFLFFLSFSLFFLSFFCGAVDLTQDLEPFHTSMLWDL